MANVGTAATGCPSPAGRSSPKRWTKPPVTRITSPRGTNHGLISAGQLAFLRNLLADSYAFGRPDIRKERHPMPRKLGPKLIFRSRSSSLPSAASAGYFNFRIQKERLVDAMILGADELSRSITSATWQSCSMMTAKLPIR